MNNEEKEVVIRKALEGQNVFDLKSVIQVNFDPHPFTIGSKHVVYASDHNGGMLTQDVVEKIPCAHPNCRLSYHQHKSDTVGFLQLQRNVTQGEAQTILKALVETIGESLVDGFTFVDTKEHYRIS